MSILDFRDKQIKQFALGENNKVDINADTLEVAEYTPNEEVKTMTAKVIRDYTTGWLNFNTPRKEFNDLALPLRAERDKAEFNNYITNDGQHALGDILQSWRSNAQRPVSRDKIIALCAAATSKLIYPKIQAYDEDNNYSAEGAEIMETINQQVQEKLDYDYKSLITTLTALWSPASIVYTGYEEKKYKVKTKKVNGVWQYDTFDTNDTGIQLIPVPVEELYISDFYTHDIQDQDFLIWRRTPTYDQLMHKYRNYKNWQYVRPGMQTLYSDNTGVFYNLYDQNIRQDLCEEIIYWNKAMDVMIILVNGIMLTEPDNPNPRIDKRYPFAKMGYELVDEGRFFYYKSLASKIYQDANIVNTLYQMVIDGTYLTVMPPMIVTGQETIGSDVIIPGAVTTLSSPNASVTPIRASQDIGAGFKALQTVEQSIMSSTREPMQQEIVKGITATEVEVRERQSNQVMGLFIKMIVKFVRDYGELSMSNIVQYTSVPDGKGNYQSFNILNKEYENGTKNMKIEFAKELLTPQMPEQLEEMIRVMWEEEKDRGFEIIKVNPKRFKELRYQVFINPDIAQSLSEQAERTFKLEIYDKAIANPYLDPEKITKKFLLGAYPQTKTNPDDFIVKNDTMGAGGQIPPQQTNDISKNLGVPTQTSKGKVGGTVPTR